MLTNCFRFAPRDSVPGLIAKICRYLKDHPGWSAEELEEFINGLIGQSLVTSFNGRKGDIIFTRNDVNDLYIAATYFAEDGETINNIDCTTLYKNGIRIVCTNYDETIGTYLLTYLLEYYKSTDTAQAYPISGGGGTGGVISVNGRTGVVNLSLADVLEAGQQVKLCSATEFTATTSATWTAYYNDGYRIVCVVNDSATAVDYLYVLKQDENNHNPIMVQTSVNSVNGKTGAVTLKVVDVTSGNSSDGNAYIFVDESSDYPSNITAQNALKLGGKAPEYYLSPRNLLDNSDFSNPVAQAGLNGMHGNTNYICDRWLNYSVTAEQHDGFMRLTNSLKTAFITQKMECNLQGKPVTIAVKVGAAVECYVGLYYTVDGTGGSISISSGRDVNGIVCFSGIVPANATGLAFRIYPSHVDGGGYVDVYWAALYEGSYTAETLPPYVPKGYAAELAECQRYCRVYKNPAECMGVLTQGAAYLKFLFDTPMRVAPSFAGSSATTYITSSAMVGYSSSGLSYNDSTIYLLTLKTNVESTATAMCMASILGDIVITADL